MATKTETLTMPLMHVYHLTADPNNDTGFTMEEVTALLNEHGPDHKIEITITTPVCEVVEEPQPSAPEPIDVPAIAPDQISQAI